MMHTSYPRISKLVTRLTAALALIVALLPVSLYSLLTYANTAARLDSNLRVQAVAMTKAISAQPEYWDLNPDRLRASYLPYVVPGEYFRVQNEQGATVFEGGPAPAWHSVVRRQLLFDFGRAVGVVEAGAPMRGAIASGVLLWCLSLALAWAIWGPVRQLPLHALRATEAALIERDRYQRALLDNFPFSVWLNDRQGRFLAANQPCAQHLGQTAAESLVGRSSAELGVASRPGGPLPNGECGAGAMSVVQQQADFAPDGLRHWFETYQAPVLTAAGELLGFVGYSQDITERKEAEERIRELAFFDQLTGLPNRTLLFDRLRQTMAASRRSDDFSALLFIDLDHFKHINDTLGHDAGDALLQQVAQRLALCVRAGDTVARLGGDEFVVVLAELSGAQPDAAMDTAAIADKILALLDQIYQFGPMAQHSSASIGATLFKGSQLSIEALLKQADLALYQAKAAGRNTVRFFDPAAPATGEGLAPARDD